MGLAGLAACAANLPPAILAMPSYNKGTGEFRMDYNGHALLQFILPPGTQLIYRRAPGAGILTTPLTEQITFAVNSKPVVAKMRWTLSPEAYCMRPRRARGDEAILGQVGVPLVFGVNGLPHVDDGGDPFFPEQADVLRARAERVIAPPDPVIRGDPAVRGMMPAQVPGVQGRLKEADRFHRAAHSSLCTVLRSSAFPVFCPSSAADLLNVSV